MNARSTAAIGVAVMCAAALRDAGAQRGAARAEIELIAASLGVTPCTQNTVFENAIRGSPLCGEAATERPPTVENTSLFLGEREREPQRGNSEVAHERVAERREAKEERRTETPPIEPRPEPRVETPRVEQPIEQPVEFDESVVTATPEPASLALVASGLVGLAVYRRRRAKGSGTINN